MIIIMDSFIFFSFFFFFQHHPQLLSQSLVLGKAKVKIPITRPFLLLRDKTHHSTTFKTSRDGRWRWRNKWPQQWKPANYLGWFGCSPSTLGNPPHLIPPSLNHQIQSHLSLVMNIQVSYCQFYWSLDFDFVTAHSSRILHRLGLNYECGHLCRLIGPFTIPLK